MINALDLKELIIKPTLKEIGLYSPAAINLLLGTAAVETDMGYYLRQRTNSGDYGAGFSIYSIENATIASIFNDYLFYNSSRMAAVLQFAPRNMKLTPKKMLKSMGDEIVGNLKLATVLARIKYYWSPMPLPNADDVLGLAKMWKVVYNTDGGAGTLNDFIEKYKRYVADVAERDNNE